MTLAAASELRGLHPAILFSMQIIVKLDRRFGTHFRATCANCRTDIEVCAKRLDGEGAERMGVEKLRKAGWHVDGRGTPRERWYCPGCSRKPHL